MKAYIELNSSDTYSVMRLDLVKDIMGECR